MSLEGNSSVDLSESFSRGEDYSHLLNDSVGQSWQYKLSRPSKKVPISKSSVKDTLNYLEEDVNHLGQEVLNLRSQNGFLEAQIQVLQTEKEMHVSAHAKEKLKLENIIKELTAKLQGENKDQTKALQIFKIKIQELEGLLEEEKQKHQTFVKKCKAKLENREKELLKIIKDKDKHIHQLQLQLEQGKCSRICSFNPVHAAHKQTRPKKNSALTIPKASYSNPISYQSKSESRLDTISNMIVKLEKDQADMSQTISDLDFSISGEKSKRSLHELMQQNEQRLKEAKMIQQSLLKEKFSSE